MKQTDLEKAIGLASWLVANQGVYMGSALNIAMRKYNVKKADIQCGMASRSGKSQKGKSKPRQPKPIQICFQEECVQHAIFKHTVWHCYQKVGVYFSCHEHRHNVNYNFEESVDKIVMTEYKPDKVAANE